MSNGTGGSEVREVRLQRLTPSAFDVKLTENEICLRQIPRSFAFGFHLCDLTPAIDSDFYNRSLNYA